MTARPAPTDALTTITSRAIIFGSIEVLTYEAFWDSATRREGPTDGFPISLLLHDRPLTLLRSEAIHDLLNGGGPLGCAYSDLDRTDRTTDRVRYPVPRREAWRYPPAGRGGAHPHKGVVWVGSRCADVTISGRPRRPGTPDERRSVSSPVETPREKRGVPPAFRRGEGGSKSVNGEAFASLLGRACPDYQDALSTRRLQSQAPGRHHGGPLFPQHEERMKDRGGRSRAPRHQRLGAS